MRRYQHSAYWYAYHEGKTYSPNETYSGWYADMHTRPGRYVEETDLFGKKKLVWKEPELLYNFNPVIFGAAIAMDIGVAMREEVRKLTDPDERAMMINELKRELRIIRRPFYYANETKRRRKLAIERRKIKRRRTLSSKPTPAQIMKAWNARKESKEAMIRLGGMLQDLECYVDNYVKYDGDGFPVGRNRGIKGWLKENLPELSDKYKTLMRYKAMVIKLRQVTETHDPIPTAKLLKDPRPKLITEFLSIERKGFAPLLRAISFHLKPELVLKKQSEIDTEVKVWRKRLRRMRQRNRKPKIPPPPIKVKKSSRPPNRS